MLQTKSGKPVSKIGIGTWTINKENMQAEVEALKYYFSQGVNYIDVVLAYDNGNVLDVVAEALKGINREDIYINAFITFGCKKPADIKKQLKYYLTKLGVKYVDCLSLHGVGVLGFSLEKYTKIVYKLKQKGKVKNLGYSNLSPEQLKDVADNIEYFEGLYNLENKMNEDNGILDICKQNDIAFYAYQPLRRNRTAKQNYPQVVKLANKYGKTQNQIIINWLVNCKEIGILIKSSNKEHIAENVSALNFKMTKTEYASLDKFRNKQFDALPFSYETEEGKIRIDQIPNQPIGIL